MAGTFVPAVVYMQSFEHRVVCTIQINGNSTDGSGVCVAKRYVGNTLPYAKFSALLPEQIWSFTL